MIAEWHPPSDVLKLAGQPYGRAPRRRRFSKDLRKPAEDFGDDYWGGDLIGKGKPIA